MKTHCHTCVSPKRLQIFTGFSHFLMRPVGAFPSKRADSSLGAVSHFKVGVVSTGRRHLHLHELLGLLGPLELVALVDLVGFFDHF
jgi:hypothetical protein